MCPNSWSPRFTYSSPGTLSSFANATTHIAAMRARPANQRAGEPYADPLPIPEFIGESAGWTLRLPARFWTLSWGAARRMWRNWQTRGVQVAVGATPWRFESSHPHYYEFSRRSAPRCFGP